MRAPPSGESAITTSPPWARATDDTIARPEARTTAIRIAGLVEPPESAQDHLAVSRGNARPVIIDVNPRVVVVGNGFDAHRVICMSAGVGHQVAQRARHQAFVDHRPHAVADDLDRRRVGTGRHGRSLGPNDVEQVDGAEIERRLLVERRQQHEVVDAARESIAQCLQPAKERRRRRRPARGSPTRSRPAAPSAACAAREPHPR